MTIDFGALILNETPDAVIVTTPDGVVVCWTRGAETVFGYTAAQAEGRLLAELVVPDEQRATERAILEQMNDDGFASYESLRRARDGTLIYIDGSCKAVHGPDGTVQHILWSKKDVTHLKVLRDAKLIDAKFRNVLESTPDSIIMANASGRIVLANSLAERMFGYGPGELRGKPLEVLMPERFRSAHLAHRHGYVAAPRPRPMGAGRTLFGLRKNDEEFPVEISLSPIDTEEGTLIMSAIRDTSERRLFETQLHEKNIELANANLAKDRFLASMSHELRTPLNAIIGFTGTLLMKLPGPLNEDQDKQLRTIQGSARHLLSLINDLLDLTKIASGKVDVTLEALVCQQIIEEVGAGFRPLVRKKGLKLILDCPDEPLAVHTDRRALQQILMNLMGNAIKFTNAGEVQVRLAQGDVEGQPCVTISVRDTGLGIAVDGQKKLFQAFTQIDAGATGRFEGTGLGLHLSQKLAHLLDGKIVFDSQYGVGSVFTLSLPVRPQPGAPWRT